MSNGVRVVIATFLMLGATAFAQTYPTKPVRFIVPFAAGGSADIVARIIAPKLGEQLGQTIVIDNRPGASAIIGVEAGAKAPPDGYTVTLGGFSSHVINAFLFPKLPYDPVRDFAPVTLIEMGAGVVFVHPSVPAKSVKDLIALAKARPGELNYGASGRGGSAHMAAEMLKSMAGLNIVYVPFKSTAGAISSLLANEVQVAIYDPRQLMPLAQ